MSRAIQEVGCLFWQTPCTAKNSSKRQQQKIPADSRPNVATFAVHTVVLQTYFMTAPLCILYRRRHMCVRCSWPPCSVNESPTIKENDKPSLVLERAKNDQQPFLIIQKRRLTPSQGPRQRVSNGTALLSIQDFFQFRYYFQLL